MRADRLEARPDVTLATTTDGVEVLDVGQEADSPLERFLVLRLSGAEALKTRTGMEAMRKFRKALASQPVRPGDPQDIVLVVESGPSTEELDRDFRSSAAPEAIQRTLGLERPAQVGSPDHERIAETLAAAPKGTQVFWGKRTVESVDKAETDAKPFFSAKARHILMVFLRFGAAYLAVKNGLHGDSDLSASDIQARALLGGFLSGLPAAFTPFVIRFGVYPGFRQHDYFKPHALSGRVIKEFLLQLGFYVPIGVLAQLQGGSFPALPLAGIGEAWSGTVLDGLGNIGLSSFADRIRRRTRATDSAVGMFHAAASLVLGYFATKFIVQLESRELLDTAVTTSTAVILAASVLSLYKSEVFERLRGCAHALRQSKQ